MAEELGTLAELFETVRPSGNFRPCAYYGEEEDSLLYFFSNSPDHARRLNSRVTIFLSDESEELVGCQIKNVRRVLEDIGWFPVIIEHGKVRLSMLFLAMRSEFGDEADARQIYRKIGEQIARTDLLVAAPITG